MSAGERRPSLQWLVIATVVSLLAFISVFFINDIEDSSFIVDIYVMLAESVAPLLTPILLVVLFARIGPQGSTLQRNARAVCAIALFAIPYYFAAGVAFSGNFEIYPNDTPIYATLAAIAFLTGVVGFMPPRRRSN